jgi:hypothetical protein
MNLELKKRRGVDSSSIVDGSGWDFLLLQDDTFHWRVHSGISQR